PSTRRVGVLVGAAGGATWVGSVNFFARVRVDDPVGAISVHGVCGTWGTLSIGLFARYDDAFLGREDAGLLYGGGVDQLVTQLLMVLAHGVFVCAAAGLLFLAIKKTIGLRVSPEEEVEGLDVLEHGSAGYGIDVVTSLPAAEQGGSAGAGVEPEPATAQRPAHGRPGSPVADR